MKWNLWKLYGCVHEEVDDTNQKATDTYSSFINSSLNIELVHIILQAITNQYQYQDPDELKEWYCSSPCEVHFNENK